MGNQAQIVGKRLDVFAVQLRACVYLHVMAEDPCNYT